MKNQQVYIICIILLSLICLILGSCSQISSNSITLSSILAGVSIICAIPLIIFFTLIVIPNKKKIPQPFYVSFIPLRNGKFLHILKDSKGNAIHESGLSPEAQQLLKTANYKTKKVFLSKIGDTKFTIEEHYNP